MSASNKDGHDSVLLPLPITHFSVTLEIVVEKRYVAIEQN